MTEPLALLSADTVAQALLAAHATCLDGHAPQSPPAAPSPADPIEHGVQQACAQLGFIEADARCIARAWARQSQRLGHFDAQAWPVHGQDFGLRTPGDAHTRFPACPARLGLYAVLPDAQWVGRMARAGVPTVQLRFKSSEPEAIGREVRAAVVAVRGSAARLFINDHWQEAIDAGAYGIHLGQEDLDALTPNQLEQLHASGLRLGVSTHGYAEMLRADAVGPSYLALGAVFPTTLKRMATAPQGLARLQAYAQLMRSHPLVAIGGIDATQLPAVLACGVGSVAVVRALVAAAQPERAAADLMARMETQMVPPA